MRSSSSIFFSLSSSGTGAISLLAQQPPSHRSSGIDVEVRYLPLYQAAQMGDWKSVEMVEVENRDAVIDAMLQTEVPDDIEHLVDRLVPEALEMKDVQGYTALHHVAIAGCLHAVKAMVRKNARLVQIPCNSGHLPLHVAAGSSTSPGKREVVWYLAIVTRDEHPHRPFGCPRGCELIRSVVAAEYFDIALFLIKRYPHLAAACPADGYVLNVLACTPFAFQSQSRLGFWESLVYPFVPVEFNDAPPHIVMRDIDGGVHSLDIEMVTTASQPAFVSQDAVIKH